MAFLKEGENDVGNSLLAASVHSTEVTLSASEIEKSIAGISNESSKGISKLQSCTIDVNVNESSNALSMFHSSTLGVEDEGQIKVGSMPCKFQINHVDHLTREAVKFVSKPRTALFQGGEDDEFMAPQINSPESFCAGLQFGVFSLDEKYTKSKELFSNAFIQSKRIFIGANYCQKKGDQKYEKTLSNILCRWSWISRDWSCMSWALISNHARRITKHLDYYYIISTCTVGVWIVYFLLCLSSRD
ncbi:hypothetical protein BS78_07G124500 [Paspalum vaginatum]|nr:hypothetical protein BS78_07G124500 [Paspalum vaginatum]